jgi:DNA-binding response OmpR family regulator
MNTPQARLLIVDDEPDICDIVAFHMQRAGFRTITATSADDAIRIFATESIDGIISDVRMPHMSGPELIRKIRQSGFSPFVVFVTGFSDKIFDQAPDLQGIEVLAKPLDWARLVQICRMATASV